MADADEIWMLRASAERSLAAAERQSEPAMAHRWQSLRAIGWEEAFVPRPVGGGVTEAVAIAQECGKAAVTLAVPALVVGLAAAVRGVHSHAAADKSAITVSGAGTTIWAALDPSARDALVPALDIADVVLVDTSDGSRVVWRGSDLVRVARRVESIDASVPLWRVPMTDDVRALGVQEEDVGTDQEFLRNLSMLVAAGEAVGLLDRALVATLDYAMSRSAFGRPIGSFQAIKHMLADSKVALETSKAVTATAVQRLDAADPGGTFTTAVAARHVGRHVVEALQWCVQVHGGIGVTIECEMHTLIRRATALRFLYMEPSAGARRIVDLYKESGRRYA